MLSYLVNDNREDKKTKGVNKNVDGKISHNEYKDISLNKQNGLNVVIPPIFYTTNITTKVAQNVIHDRWKAAWISKVLSVGVNLLESLD